MPRNLVLVVNNARHSLLNSSSLKINLACAELCELNIEIIVAHFPPFLDRSMEIFAEKLAHRRRLGHILN
jgi:secreted trypsin-like serine protease